MSYAVVWSQDGGNPAAGRLELTCRSLQLVGRPTRELRLAEMAGVHIERSAALRLAGRPTLVIETRDGGSLRIASLDGAGTLHELAERLQRERPA